MWHLKDEGSRKHVKVGVQREKSLISFVNIVDFVVQRIVGRRQPGEKSASPPLDASTGMRLIAPAFTSAREKQKQNKGKISRS